MKGDTYSGIVFDEYGPQYSQTEFQFISQNIERVLLTRKGERVNEPEFGSNLMTYLFMPNIQLSSIMEEVKFSVEKFEPRVKVKEITISGDNEKEIVKIDMQLVIKSTNELMGTSVEVNV